MLYRMRIYQAVPENLPAFHEFFRRWLLPPIVTSKEEAFMSSTLPPGVAR